MSEKTATETEAIVQEKAKKVGRFRAAARAFGASSLKHQAMCVGLFLLGYLFPVAGIVAYVIQRIRKSDQMWRFFALAGPIVAMLVFVANFVFLAVNGQI